MTSLELLALQGPDASPPPGGMTPMSLFYKSFRTARLAALITCESGGIAVHFGDFLRFSWILVGPARRRAGCDFSGIPVISGDFP